MSVYFRNGGVTGVFFADSSEGSLSSMGVRIGDSLQDAPKAYDGLRLTKVAEPDLTPELTTLVHNTKHGEPSRGQFLIYFPDAMIYVYFDERDRINSLLLKCQAHLRGRQVVSGSGRK